MGLLDRFHLNSGPALIVTEDVTSEQEATSLIEEGHALEAQDKPDEAMKCYLEAVRIAPNPARAHLNRGNILLLKGDLGAALDAFRTAIRYKPDYAGAYYNMGNALMGNGQFYQAIEGYRGALKIQPDYAEAYCGLGVAFKEMGKIEEAITSFQHALKFKPDLVEARANIGNILENLFNASDVLLNNGDAAIVEKNMILVLNIEPNLAEAHERLGNARRTLGNLEGALESYGRAIELKPDFAKAYNDKGVILQELGRMDEAIESYDLALKIEPDCANINTNLGNSLQEMGKLNDATVKYRLAMEIDPGYLDAHQGMLFTLNYMVGNTSLDYLNRARQYGKIVTNNVGVRFAAWNCSLTTKRLRVGLMSGDFISHPVGFFLESILAQVDQNRIELIAYPTDLRRDELTARIRPYFSQWKPLVGLGDKAAANQIHDDDIHILIDLSGHTRHNRLPVFAWKPAPIQVSWLGYFATTGMMEMDYVLTDELSVPDDQRWKFTESIWCLPDTRLCFTEPETDLPVSPLPALLNNVMTFGCFQSLAKLNDDVIKVWGEVLAAIPNARLRLQCKYFGEQARLELLQRFQQNGVPSSRVIMCESTSREAYLAAHAEVDIILDTFPYPGGTTTCEALWMGVPTLTLAGDNMLSRQGASLLTAANMPEWVTTNKREYVAKAIELAGDCVKLATLRAGLRQQVLASPLFNAPRFARNFEDALWGMWKKYKDELEKRE